MEKTEIIKIIDQLNTYRFKRMKRDNLQWHVDLDSERGYLSLVESRTKLLGAAQADLDLIEQQTLDLISDMKEQYASNPRSKELRLISMYIELLNLEPKQMEKQRQKIATLRREVLGKMDEIQRIREQYSIYPDIPDISDL